MKDSASESTSSNIATRLPPLAVRVSGFDVHGRACVLRCSASASDVAIKADSIKARHPATMPAMAVVLNLCLSELEADVTPCAAADCGNGARLDPEFGVVAFAATPGLGNVNEAPWDSEA